MSLLNLIENIISGNLLESQLSFKSVLAEKISQKLEEKKLSKKQKQLDKNHNGKLDSDDSKKLRGEKGCHSDCNESIEVIKSRNGKKIGEVYPHEGGWGCLHYKSDQGSTHNDTKEDAIQTLKDIHNQFNPKNEELDLESQLAEALAELEEARFEKGQDIGKPNTGKDTGFKNLEHKLTPKYGKESAKKIAGSVLQKILHKK